MKLQLLSLLIVCAPPVSQATGADAVAKIEELGGAVRYVSRADKSLEVDLRFASEKLVDADLACLAMLKKVAILRLKGTNISDSGLKHIPRVAGLRELDLANTKVTGRGLRNLPTLKQLEVLNLYGTAIGDDSLAVISRLPKLRLLVVTNTKVTPTGIQDLRKRFPRVRIIPDRRARQARAKAAWEVATAARKRAEQALATAQDDLKLLGPRAGKLRAEYQTARKKLDALRKASDRLRRKADDSRRKAKDAEKKLNDARKKLQKSPGDERLRKDLVARQSTFDRAMELSAKDQQAHQAEQRKANMAQKATDDLKNRSDRASGAKRRVEEAKIALEAARQAEQYAEQRTQRQ